MTNYYLKFGVSVEQIDGEVIFKMSGPINESMGPFVQELASKMQKLNFIRFDLGAVISINSAGTREWTILMKKSESVSIELANCPKVFIDQINLVQGFISPATTIKSFYVPYYNEDLGEDKKVLFRTDQVFLDPLKLVPDKIVESEKTFEIDVIKTKYLAFLSRNLEGE